MSLQGIDISNWQKGINLDVLAIDFVICKATQGTSYVSPDCDRQMQQAMRRGLLVGVYHYVDGSGVDAEAQHFASSIKGYLGKAILAIDWESDDNAKWGDLSYLSALIAKVKELTGVTPLLYSSQSMYPWDVADANDSGRWVAQYANMKPTGLQATPWNEGAYSCAIRQYASTGRLDGWGGDLDLDKAYMNAEQWQAYAAVNGAAQPAPTPTAPATGVENMDALDLVAGVWRGDYGTDDARRAALGGRYEEVQAIINHISQASTDVLVKETWAGDYRNGSEREAILAHRYDEVMAAINGSAAGTIYTVKAGDTLSSIAAKHGTTYQQLAKANGIADPNKIYPGQRLSI